MSEADFEAAATRAKSFSGLSNDKMLNLYKYYKQATVGDINTDRPGMFDPQGRYKWDAWNSVKGTSKEEARAKYIALVAEYAQ
jgi:diazepam-binding inhibitor (GABA receptor modulating acyl-CoA-binding protein)